jgi:hypothetical protein
MDEARCKVELPPVVERFMEVRIILPNLVFQVRLLKCRRKVDLLQRLVVRLVLFFFFKK